MSRPPAAVCCPLAPGRGQPVCVGGGGGTGGAGVGRTRKQVAEDQGVTLLLPAGSSVAMMGQVPAGVASEHGGAVLWGARKRKAFSGPRGPAGAAGLALSWAASPGGEEPPGAAAGLPTACRYHLQGWMTPQGGRHPRLRGDTGLSEERLRGRGPGMAGERPGEAGPGLGARQSGRGGRPGSSGVGVGVGVCSQHPGVAKGSGAWGRGQSPLPIWQRLTRDASWTDRHSPQFHR